MTPSRFRTSACTLVPLLLAGLGAGAVAAQEGHPGHGAHGAHSPYADRIDRAIKALSEEDLEGLRIGAGMELALPAELNGYPGPKHALELADALELTRDQRDRLEAVRRDMQTEARALGERVIAAERAVDALFAEGRAGEEAVGDAAAEAGRLWGALRATHLVAHVETREILTPEQVATYQRLRGYDPGR